MNGRLTGFSLNRDGSQNITVTVAADFAETFDELKDSEITVEIKKARKKRSLDANAYAWVLIDKIAEKTGVKKTDVYREEIKELGGVSIFGGIKTDAFPAFQKAWETGHLGRQTVLIPGSTKEGWSNIKITFGSSDFDSEQMHRLISNLIQDAEQLGIPTITPEEEARLIGLMNHKKESESLQNGNQEHEGRNHQDQPHQGQ